MNQLAPMNRTDGAVAQRGGNGVPEYGDPRLPARFWKRVSVDGHSGCWIWNGAENGIGYGVLAAGKKQALANAKGHRVYAHRAAYHHLVGEIDQPALDHLCRNRGCVNPAHLEPVSMAENTRRGVSQARRQAKYKAQTHCKRGHPLFGDNLRISNGRRVCRMCAVLATRRYREKGAQ